MSFGDSAPWSVGVEEEIFLVDAATLDTVPLFSSVVPEPGPRMKSELFACIVEITTPICEDAAEVLAELKRLRHEVIERARPYGATILAAGMHPTAVGDGQPIVPEQRYLDLVAGLGDRIYRQLVCGIHVHVGVPDEESCLRALEGVLPWLPVLLSLSANSPFAEGESSGVRSARAGRLAELPRGGPPPAESPARCGGTAGAPDRLPGGSSTWETMFPPCPSSPRQSRGFAAAGRGLGSGNRRTSAGR